MSTEAALISLRKNDYRVEGSIRHFTVHGAPWVKPTEAPAVKLADRSDMQHDDWCGVANWRGCLLVHALPSICTVNATTLCCTPCCRRACTALLHATL